MDSLFFLQHVTGSRSVVPIQFSYYVGTIPGMLKKVIPVSFEDFMQFHISAHKLRYSNEGWGNDPLEVFPPMQTATSILSIIGH